MDKITHWYDEAGNHWLEVNGKQGPRVEYSSPARNGQYLAFTQYFGEEEVLRIDPVQAESGTMLTPAMAAKYKAFLTHEETIVNPREQEVKSAEMEYNETVKAARDKYSKIVDSAMKEYCKIIDSATAESCETIRLAQIKYDSDQRGDL